MVNRNIIRLTFIVYRNRRSNYVLRNHASSPIGLSTISSTSIRLMGSIVRFQRSIKYYIKKRVKVENSIDGVISRRIIY